MTPFATASVPTASAELCWGARAGVIGCVRCMEACPVGAIAVDRIAGIRITGECLGCDRCVAVCPTEALASSNPGPRWRLRPGSLGAAITLGCHRSKRSTGDRVTMHCLARLDAAGVIELAAEAGFRPLVADLGACADCPAGAAAPGFRAEIEAAAAALAAVGVPAEQRPTVIGDAGAATAASAGRRAFLRRTLAAGRPVRVARPAAKSGSPVAVPPQRRRRLRAAQRRAASAFGAAPPAAGFFAVEVAESCAGHGVCGSVCPTGALRIADDDGTRTLLFAGVDCIGCGACAASCPTGAVRVAPAVGDVDRQRVLMRRARRVCASCDETFVGAGDRELCPSCAKERGLFAGAGPAVAASALPDPSQWRIP